jgi:hypothetical protein
VLVRVGVIAPEPERDWKLVLAMEAALPELHHLSGPDPDSRSFAKLQPQLTLELLKELVTSPVFPRTAADFELRPPTELQSVASGYAR